MAGSMSSVLQQMCTSPALAAAVALSLGVLFVNGWTDAPNAIATAVGAGALKMERAIALAAVCNFLGALSMTALSAGVAMTIFDLVSFGGNTGAAWAALSAAQLAIILWAVAAWWFGIPTSESHALAAALTGAALALQGNLSSVSAAAWGRVLWGLVLSVLLGFVLGGVFARLLGRLCRGRGKGFFRRAQIFGAAAMAFMHGAQDGQKFLGVLLLTLSLCAGAVPAEPGAIYLWQILLCAGVMAAGTAVGGRRIIRAVGQELTPLTVERGFAADLGGALALGLLTVLGLPASTTHAKTTAVMGAGCSHRAGLNLRRSAGMALAWLLTFPACGFLGYLLARLFC